VRIAGTTLLNRVMKAPSQNITPVDYPHCQADKNVSRTP
jgi:hypothetical protein